MEKFLELVLRWLTSAYTHQPPLDFHTFQFQCFLILIVLLYYLICIQYNILLLIRNTTSNNHHLHSNSMSKDYDFNIKSNYSYNIHKNITHNPIFFNPKYYKSQITHWIWDQFFCKKKQHKYLLKSSQHIKATIL